MPSVIVVQMVGGGAKSAELALQLFEPSGVLTRKYFTSAAEVENRMYRAFDDFLGAETWYLDDQCSEAAFYRALDKVVRHATFDPDEMAIYMFEKTDALQEEDPRAKAIDRYRDDAWVIRNYLGATGGL